MGASNNISIMSVSLDITYFLSIQTWAEYGYTNVNTDTKKLLPIIAAVQRTRIEQVIGTTLYNKIVTDVKAGTLTGDYKTLMDDHILPTMIAYCDWKATFHTTYQITNKTTGKNRDEHIEPNDQSENNALRQELLKDAKTYEKKMKAWLCDNWNDIPELYEAVDQDQLRQTIAPHLDNDNDYFGNIGIV